MSSNRYRDSQPRGYSTLAAIDNSILYEWDNNLAKVVNYVVAHEPIQNMGKPAIFHAILEIGIQTCMKRMAKGGDNKARIHVAMKKRMNEEDKRIAEVKGFFNMCDKIGPIEFEKWAIEMEIDPEPILKQYKLGHVFDLQETWADRARRWLSSIMDDGVPREFVAIKELAIRDDLIENNDADWNKLKTLASRHGYASGARGYWQLPLHNSLMRT